MIDDAARVRLRLESRPESVTLVRAALTALAEVAELDEESLNDLNTAVSEACNNVVLHAYDGSAGPLIVSMTATADALDVLVEDYGTGLRQVASSEDRMRVGLAVIRALADTAEFTSRPSGGTQVRMSFNRGGSRPRTVARAPVDAPPEPVGVELAGDAVLWLEPSTLLAPVLGRVCRALAAWTHFSIDRVEGLYAITDAIGDYAEHAAAGPWIGFSLTASARRLELTGAPFATDGRRPEDPASKTRRSLIADLVDRVALEPAAGFERMSVVITERRGRDDGDARASA